MKSLDAYEDFARWCQKDLQGKLGQLATKANIALVVTTLLGGLNFSFVALFHDSEDASLIQSISLDVMYFSYASGVLLVLLGMMEFRHYAGLDCMHAAKMHELDTFPTDEVRQAVASSIIVSVKITTDMLERATGKIHWAFVSLLVCLSASFIFHGHHLLDGPAAKLLEFLWQNLIALADYVLAR